MSRCTNNLTYVNYISFFIYRTFKKKCDNYVNCKEYQKLYIISQTNMKKELQKKIRKAAYIYKQNIKQISGKKL